jgi:hypothetical protein
MARCGGGSGGCGSRVHPRPSVSVSATTSESARQRVEVDSRIGQILGGSVTRKTSNGETAVTIALWRTSTSTDGDFIDRFDVDLETSGGEAGQGSFAFCLPQEFSHPTLRAFWFTVRNTSSPNEDYVVHFDVFCLEV